MSFKISISESMVDLIIKRIQENIKPELDGIAAEKNDPTLVLQEPQSYFIFENAINLTCPAIYVLVNDVDFKNERGQNFIDAQEHVQISVVFEAPTEDKCVRGLWRYVDALFNVLDHWQLSTPDNRSKNVLIQTGVAYTGLVKTADQQQNIFRKEAMLTFNVEHWETLQN